MTKLVRVTPDETDPEGEFATPVGEQPAQAGFGMCVYCRFGCVQYVGTMLGDCQNKGCGHSFTAHLAAQIF